MGRNPCCSKEGLNRGAWTAQEDKLLTQYIKAHGEGKWRNVAKKSGLKRCGKSCRLRWLNYLRPDIKRGNISPDEEDLIIRLHRLLGNRWALIAGRLPGRTDNEIKNYWNTVLCKKKMQKDNHKLASSPPDSDSAPKMASHQAEAQQERDINKEINTISSASLNKEFSASSGSSLLANYSDLQDFFLDFEVGELYISDFFKYEFSSCDLKLS